MMKISFSLENGCFHILENFRKFSFFFTLDDLLYRPESYSMLRIEPVDIVVRVVRRVRLSVQSAVRLMRLHSCQRPHPNRNISALECRIRSFDEPIEQNQLLFSVQFNFSGN